MMRFFGMPAARFAILAGFALAGCSETQLIAHTVKTMSREAPSEPEQGAYKLGKPYRINGVWYYPAVNYRYDETGIASWYGPNFHGQRTANGERFDMNQISAAHRTLPLPSMVQVTNLENGRTINVRVNDRGPFAHGRVIDVSRRAAQLLGFARKGTAKVRVRILADESRQLAATYGTAATGAQLARAGEDESVLPLPRDAAKPPVKAAPREPVIRARLGPPGETAAAEAAPWNVRPAPTIPASAGASAPVVTRVPVDQARMYIQAGAFARFDNANRLRARLSVLGPARITAVRLGKVQMFRVRVGPIDELPAADRMLEQVIAAGYTDAQIIVDR